MIEEATRGCRGENLRCEGNFTPNDALKGRRSPRAKHAWCDSMIDVGT